MKMLKDEYPSELCERVRGGDGSYISRHFLKKEDAAGSGRLFSVNTFEPGVSIGVHEHHGEIELYYILSGTAAITDNGEVYELHAGDMMLCRDGDSHGIANKSGEDMQFLAMILYSRD